jgi:hypothetical protein
MWWFILTVLMLFGLLLVLPIEVEIDTEKGVYRAGWRGICGIRGLPGERKWRWIMRIFFFEKEWQAKPEKPKLPKKPAAKKRGLTFTPRRMWQITRNIFRAIRVKRLRLEWDTDDFALNARLYPFFRLLCKERRAFSINFSGRQELSIHLQTRLYRLAWAFLQVFFQPKSASHENKLR